MDRPSKRRKLSSENLLHTENRGDKLDRESANHPTGLQATNDDDARPLKSLSRSITPPPRSRPQGQSSHLNPQDNQTVDKLPVPNGKAEIHSRNKHLSTIVPSPIKLTHIRDLPSSSGNNVDTIKLRDILGDPMIRECWQFNYLFDVDFLMSQFDEDVRSLVQVKVVHGSWKREAPNRVRIDVS
jgi:tyrosyl-DNA phosphodiesterase-1